MEDSMELPSQIDNQQNQEIHFFVSPNNSVKKSNQQIVNTASQQSLAYSSQTHARYENVQRSPIVIQLPNFENSQRPASLKKMIRAANADVDKSPTLLQTRSEEHLFTMPSKEEVIRQDRRKTVLKKEQTNMSKKYKEMEYALQVEVINCQQLRTKVSILTELLQQKIKDSDLSFILSFKNSSRNMKNIDIFVQLKQSQKRLKQSQLIIEQQKNQIKRLSEEFRVRSSRKQNLNTGNIDPIVQMEALMEEKQSLFNYIEELRKEYNEKNLQYKQMFEELERCQQKQQMFVSVQRPKLIRQISERTGQIKKLQSEIEQLRMENNLIELKLENQIEEFKNTKKQDERRKQQSIGIMTTEIICRPTSTQTQLEDFEMQTLKAELKLLKSERDYYMQEFKKKAAESSQNYLLKLQLKAYQIQNN